MASLNASAKQLRAIQPYEQRQSHDYCATFEQFPTKLSHFGKQSIVMIGLEEFIARTTCSEIAQIAGLFSSGSSNFSTDTFKLFNKLRNFIKDSSLCGWVIWV